MANRKNLAVVEDCLKAVYTAGEWDARGRTVTEIATQLRTSTSTTSSLVRRLAEEGLVRHEPYGDVALTPEGLAQALRVVRRHRLVETFLVEHLDYSWDQVHDEAEVLEHTISDFMLERVDASLGEPWRDPHGDPIPDATGVVHLPHARPLAGLDPGERGYVVRILDASAELLRWFETQGITLDLAVHVVEQRPFAGPLVVQLGDEDARTLDLGLEAVGALWIGPDLPSTAPVTARGCHYPRCVHAGGVRKSELES